MSTAENSRDSEKIQVNGTLVWYYYICHREVWLMAHRITPNKYDDNIEYGRYISEHSYGREKKEIEIGPVKIDILSARNGKLVVSEVKKSSKYIESAKMQLLLYLEVLEQAGIKAEGELRFPLEKRREKILLTTENREELNEAKVEIIKIIYKDKPPELKRIRWCYNCAYREFCWS